MHEANIQCLGKYYIIQSMNTEWTKGDNKRKKNEHGKLRNEMCAC
jgi:hypothetical protein